MMNKTKAYNYILILVMALMVMAAMFCANIVPISNGIDDNLSVYREGAAISMVSGDFEGAAIGDIDKSIKTLNKVGKRIGITNLDKSLVFSRAMDSAYGQVLRYQQVYKGIAVYGREMIVNVDNNGNILHISGNYLDNVKPINSQKLSQDDIKQLAKDNVILSIQPVIYTLNGSVSRYASVVECKDKTIIYDQSNGKVLDSIGKEQGVITTQTNALGEKVNIDVAQSYGKYYLEDSIRNIMVYDYSARKGDDTPIYAWSGQLDDRIAVSVYDYLAKSYDFYADASNLGIARKGIADNHDNTAGNYDDEYVLQVIVHYEEKAGVPYVNAAYVDDRPNGFMMIGDGARGDCYDLGKALDVIAHEYQHGITTYTAGLRYLNQSGAINEAMSDIFAVCIGDDPLDSVNAWLIGEQIIDDGSKALRDMADPLSLGYPYQLGGDYYHEECHLLHNHGVNQCDSGGVHVNSSIINNVAYNIYNADKAFFTKQRIATLWYNTLLGLPQDCTFKVLKENMLQNAVTLGYSQEHLKAISNAYARANISTKTTVIFQNNDSEIVGELPAAMTAAAGETIAIPGANLTKEGHEFVGWKEIDSYGNILARYTPGQEVLFKYNVVLYPLMALQPMNTDVGIVKLQGSGKANQPYLVSTAQDFMSMAYYITNGDAFEDGKRNILGETSYAASYYELTADIDMSEIVQHFVPINIKNLHKTVYLDGKGHKLKGINIDINQLDSPLSVGLFSTLYGEVSRLGIDMTITGDRAATQYVGVVAGVSHGMINSVAANADINITNALSDKIRIGGIAGYSAKGIADVSFDGSIVSNTRNTVAGGIVGVANCDSSNKKVGIESDIISISHSVDTKQTYNSRSNITATNNVINYGDITAHISGGIVGEIYHGKVVNALNFGTIKASGAGGGIVGRVNDWGEYIGGTWTSDNKKMNVRNADVHLAGCHNIGEVVSGSAGEMLGIYAKQGYKLVLEKCYGTQTKVSVGEWGSFAGDDVVHGNVMDNSQIVYSATSVYSNNDYFATMAGGTPFAQGTLWAPVSGRLVVNTGVSHWIELAADEYGGGKGTQTSPYIISTAAHLGKAAKDSLTQQTTAKVFYKQTANIDLSGAIWHSIGAKFSDKKDSDSAAIYYFAQGFAITNMVARQQSVTLQDKENTEYTAVLYASFAYGSNYNVNALNVVDCNISGNDVAGVAVLAGSIRYCNVDGNISAMGQAGGIAGAANSIEYCVVKATIGGVQVGGIANMSKGNITGNYASIYATVSGGEEIFTVALGGIVAITTETVSKLTVLNNNTVKLTANILHEYADVGGAIGRITDYDGANVSLINNKVVLQTDAKDEKNVSIGGLIGSGNIAVSVSASGTLNIKAENNGYSSAYNECGNMWEKSIDSAYYSSKNNQAIDESVTHDYVLDKTAILIAESIDNDNHIAYLLKDGEVNSVTALVDGRLVLDGTKVVGTKEKFEGWAHADNTIVEDEQYDTNIYVYAKSSAIEDLVPGLGLEDEGNSLSWVWVVVITVGAMFAVGAVATIIVIVVRQRKRY